MDSLLREYERLAKNGDASAERRLIELKKRAGCLDIYIVEECHFDYTIILDIFFQLEAAVMFVEQKCRDYRRYAQDKPLKWRKNPLDSLHKNAELAYYWVPEASEPYSSDPGYALTCFIK